MRHRTRAFLKRVRLTPADRATAEAVLRMIAESEGARPATDEEAARVDTPPDSR